LPKFFPSSAQLHLSCFRHRWRFFLQREIAVGGHTVRPAVEDFAAIDRDSLRHDVFFSLFEVTAVESFQTFPHGDHPSCIPPKIWQDKESSVSLGSAKLFEMGQFSVTTNTLRMP